MLTGGIDISVGSLVAMDCMILAVGMERWNMNAVLLCILCACHRDCVRRGAGLLCRLSEYPAVHCDNGGNVLRQRHDSRDQQWNRSPSAAMHFCKALPIRRSAFRLALYQQQKGVVQVPFIRVSVIVALLVLIAVFFMLRYTKFGRSLYAVGGSEQSATMMGLDVKKTKLKAYVLSLIPLLDRRHLLPPEHDVGKCAAGTRT